MYIVPEVVVVAEEDPDLVAPPVADAVAELGLYTRLEYTILYYTILYYYNMIYHNRLYKS